MEYMIVIMVIIFFLGSASFIIPSKKTKFLAQLRLDAAKLGFKISSLAHSKISFQSKDLNLASYQLKNNLLTTINKRFSFSTQAKKIVFFLACS